MKGKSHASYELFNGQIELVASDVTFELDSKQVEDKTKIRITKLN